MQSASCFPFTHSPWVEHPTLVLDGSPIFLFNPPLCEHHWVYMHTPASSSSIVSTPVPALYASICKTDLTKPLPPACSSSHIPLQPSICETDLTKPLPPACSSSHIPLQPSICKTDLTKPLPPACSNSRILLQPSICETDLTKPLPPACSSSHIPLQPSKDIRNIYKHKYVTVLTDAVIRSLCVTHSLPYHSVLIFVILIIPSMLLPFKRSEESVEKPIAISPWSPL